MCDDRVEHFKQNIMFMYYINVPGHYNRINTIQYNTNTNTCIFQNMPKVSNNQDNCQIVKCVVYNHQYRENTF